MIVIELLNPKSDYVFKRIFGYSGNEEITKNFLQAITNEKIEKIELDCNPITEKNLLDDKVGILDIKAKLNDNTNCKNELDKWLKFINNPEENVDMGNKEIKKAKEVLEEISQDENERYLAELREKYIMDQKAIEGAGYDKGVKAGIEQGKQRNKIEIAKKMKNKKMSIADISEITGLSEDEIKNL